MSDQFDPYDGIAEWYDLEHDTFADDIECYLSLVAAPASGRAAIVEIGSGTGRIAAALAAAGHQVTGIEPSTAMRRRAEERFLKLPDRVRHRVRSEEGSATAPGLSTTQVFDMALFGQGSYAHLTTVDDRYEALVAVSRLIRPGGQIVLDIDLLGPKRLLEFPRLLWWQGSWALPDSSGELMHFVAGTPGPLPSTVDVLHVYDLYHQGDAVKRTTSNMLLAALTYGEVVSEVLRAGFSIESTYGSYDLGPFEHDSPRLILDARR